VNMVYFGQFNYLWHSPLPFLSHVPFFGSFQYILLRPLPAQIQIFQYYWCSIILFYFPSSPKFQSVLSLLPTYSTCRCVYDHVWVCVYVYLLDLSFTYERKHVSFVFLTLA
jgi:hypothetical protein